LISTIDTQPLQSEIQTIISAIDLEPLQSEIQTLDLQPLKAEIAELVDAIDLQPLKTEIQALLTTITTQRRELETSLEKLLTQIASQAPRPGELVTVQSTIPAIALPPEPLVPTAEPSETDEALLAPQWHELINQLSDYEYWALEAILRGDAEELRQIADAVPTMPQMLVDAINEKADAIIDDLIFEPGTSSLIPQIYEDYEEYLQRAIAVVGRENFPVTTIDVEVTDVPAAIAALPAKLGTWKCRVIFETGANALAISPNSQTLISGGSDNKLQVWALKGEWRQTLPHPENSGSIYALAMHPSGKLLFSSGSSNTIKVWNLKTGELIRTLTGHTTAVNAIAVNPDGQLLASGSADRSIKVWDIRSGRLLQTLSGYGFITSVVFSPRPDKDILASGDQNGTIHLWNLDTRTTFNSLPAHASKVCSMAFSPDGKTIISGGADGTIKLWDLGPGVSSSLALHKGQVSAVAVSPNGQFLISGGEDCTLKVWDLESRELLATLSDHTGKICAIAFAPDGNTLVSSSADQTIRVWRYS